MLHVPRPGVAASADAFAARRHGTYPAVARHLFFPRHRCCISWSARCYASCAGSLLNSHQQQRQHRQLLRCYCSRRSSSSWVTFIALLLLFCCSIGPASTTAAAAVRTAAAPAAGEVIGDLLPPGHLVPPQSSSAGLASSVPSSPPPPHVEMINASGGPTGAASDSPLLPAAGGASSFSPLAVPVSAPTQPPPPAAPPTPPPPSPPPPPAGAAPAAPAASSPPMPHPPRPPSSPPPMPPPRPRPPRPPQPPFPPPPPFPPGPPPPPYPLVVAGPTALPATCELNVQYMAADPAWPYFMGVFTVFNNRAASVASWQATWNFASYERLQASSARGAVTIDPGGADCARPARPSSSEPPVPAWSSSPQARVSLRSTAARQQEQLLLAAGPSCGGVLFLRPNVLSTRRRLSLPPFFHLDSLPPRRQHADARGQHKRECAGPRPRRGAPVRIHDDHIPLAAELGLLPLV